MRPTQLHGIEINPYAAELAQVVIWIGYLQWMRDNGFAVPRNPILEPLQTIRCADAMEWTDVTTSTTEPRPSGRAVPGVNAGARKAQQARLAVIWPQRCA